MLSEIKIKKISDWLWEIPRDFREDMRVPARIYISESLLKKIEKEALIQLINTTTIPGVVRYTLGMPDIHSGYGPPIGGVGAMRLSDGVISPGFVGFDENCTSPETKILTENGAFISIKDLEEFWQERKVENVNFQEKNITHSQVIRFFKQYNNPTIYRIETVSGNEIKATEDHPIQTKQGMKKIKDLQDNESVLIYPFKGVEYKKPSFEMILSEEDFRKTLKELGRNNFQGHAVSQILNHLNSRNLLPVKFNSSFLPSILKLMGFIFGDGVLSLGKDNKNVQIQFYAGPQDLKAIQKDIKKLGFKPSQIYSRKRDYSFTNAYKKTYNFSQTEYRVKIDSRSLAYLLVALGTPYGVKSHKSYRVPNWIFKCPLWQKRLFLASFFGAELSTPLTLNKYNFYAPQLNMQKAKGLERNAKLFLKDIAALLREFKIETHSIQEVPGYRYKGKQGETLGFRLQIKEKVENLVRFFESLNYEYNQNKFKEACLAANYLKRKLKVIKLRAEIREKIKILYQKKGDFKKIAKKYISKYTPSQFLYHSLFEENRWGVRKKRGNPRIAFDFPSFEEYKNQHAWGNRGLVWDEIEKIEKIPYQDFVYDFTVNHPDHNFIANNFVVSNCGVRLLKTDYTEKEIKPYLEKLATEIQKEVPSGLGRGRKIKLEIKEIDKILEGGVPYLVEQGYGEEGDIQNCEEEGKMQQAEVSDVSRQAKERGRDQVGTLGSGNHFLEIQKIEEIFDSKIAEIFGLFKDQVVVMIHTGSRGLGHQNCTDYLRVMVPAMRKYKIKIPDKELACAPFNSLEGQRFFRAMSAACNYAWANRQMITHYTRKAWRMILGGKTQLKLLYDVAHNIAKIEEHMTDGQRMKLIVHRKGATRAFPPKSSEIPERYRKSGQPVIIPGSMGTASYILAGIEDSKDAWHTVNHGAGRVMSRHAAIRQISGQEVIKRLKSKGIIVRSQSMRGIAEEAPSVYKDIDEVIEIVSKAKLAKKVARLLPLAVIKGE